MTRVVRGTLLGNVCVLGFLERQPAGTVEPYQELEKFDPTSLPRAREARHIQYPATRLTEVSLYYISPSDKDLIICDPESK